jgi:hypothetical protein
LSDRSVGFAEVRGEEHVKEVAGKAFDGVRDGEDGNALGLKNFSAKNLQSTLVPCTHVFDVGAGVNGDDVAVLDSEIVSNNSIYTRTTII